MSNPQQNRSLSTQAIFWHFIHEYKIKFNPTLSSFCFLWSHTLSDSNFCHTVILLFFVVVVVVVVVVIVFFICYVFFSFYGRRRIYAAAAAAAKLNNKHKTYNYMLSFKKKNRG